MSRPGVLLDRDGTIIADRGYVGTVDRVEFLDGAIEAIAQLNRAGIPVAVVTNQAGVARGYYGIEDVHQVHKHMIEELARQGAHVDLWLFCPYHPDGIVESFARASADRKPGPGMALAAARARSASTSPRRGSWATAPATSGWPARSAPAPLHVGPAPARTADVHVRSRTCAGRRPTHPRRRRRAERRRPQAVRSRLMRYETARTLRPRLRRASSARALATVDVAAVDRGRRGARRTPTTATRRSSPAATAARPRSPTTSSATTSRASASAPTCTPGCISLSTNVEMLSAIANDIGYDDGLRVPAASRWRGPATCWSPSRRRGGRRTSCGPWSGRERHGMQTIALTGFAGGAAREHRRRLHPRRRPTTTGSSRTRTRPCMHLLAQYVRQSRMTPDAVATTGLLSGSCASRSTC